MDGSEEHQKFKVMGLEFRTLGMGLEFVLDLGLRLGLGAKKKVRGSAGGNHEVMRFTCPYMLVPLTLKALDP